MALAFPVEPMTATLGSMPPASDDDRWAYEVKWDGYRTLAFVGDDGLRLQSRRLHDVTATYPELAELPGSVHAATAILDAELVVLDELGRPRFELIQRHEQQAVLYVFDVLRIGEHDTIGLGYLERRRLLEQLLEPGDNWLVPPHHVGDGAALHAATLDMQLEGVLAKRIDSTYTPGKRTPDWRKIKHRQRADVTIGGFTRGDGTREGRFGALLVGRPDAESGLLQFAGGVGTGFNQATLDSLHAALMAAATDACPFDPPPPANYRRAATWVRPELGATIEVTEFTNDGYARQASFIALTTPAGHLGTGPK